MTIRWITTQLGTAPASELAEIADVFVVDVRDLVDKVGNPVDAVREKITEGVKSLSLGQRTVICCDYGMSRSNAIAAGVLSSYEKTGFDEALRKVQEATGEMQIKTAPLNAVRKALGLQADKKIRNMHPYSVLVTGGYGFVGTALIASIASDYRVVAPSRKQLDVAAGSTQLDMLTSEENISCIVHLANPNVYTSNIAMGQSLTMLRNVIDTCLARDIRLIYLSIWEIYSGYPGTLIADESISALPRGPYGETKYLAELLIDHSQHTEGLKCAILRSSPVYGTGSDKPKFIYNFIDKIRHSKTIITHYYQNGDPALDLMYIDDLVSAIRLTIESQFTGTINLGTGTLTSTRMIAEILIDRLSGNSRIEQIPINTNVASIAMNWSKAQKHLGWQPLIPLNKGLECVLAEMNLIKE